MVIRVYGKKGCGKCESAKKNIKRMGLSYIYEDIESVISANNLPEDWRSRNYAEIMADYTFLANLPMIKIDDQPTMEYSQAMKELKQIIKKMEEEKLAATA